MLPTLILTIIIAAIAIAGMAIGVIFSNRALKGSCGGVGGKCACDEAGKPRECEQPNSEQSPTTPREDVVHGRLGNR